MKRTQRLEPLAIVGMSCLFPKAQSLEDYWANIKEKVDCITEVPESHWNGKDYYDENKKCPDHVYTKNGGFLDPVDFNPAEWGISPSDLDSIDTSQLLSLVVARGALADAGYGKKDFDRENTNVILGLTGCLELVIPLGARLGHPFWRKAMLHAGIDEKITDEVIDSIGKCYVGWQENSFPGLLGNCASGRIANRLNLGGTNCVVDAACGSSLAALNMAAMELWTGKANMAITGGIDTFNDIFMFMCFCKTPALSPTGHSRPFSADNDGTIIGEGIGMVVLKRLSDAEKDGDRIYACINAIGTSSDGKGKAVYAPSIPGQVKALKRAYEESGLTPREIGMIEAHGTGTAAGDKVEIDALKEVYGVSGTNRPWCALGSVKSQIGHTKAAAGSANLIKAAMALYSKVIPPTIKISKPTEALTDENIPFYLPDQPRPWVADEGQTRHAAVASMGFGGTNFHVILSEYKSEKLEYDWERNVELVSLSGENATEIKSKLQGLKEAKNLRRFAAESRKAFRVSDKARLCFVIDSTTDIEKTITDIAIKLDTCENKDFSLPNGTVFSTLTQCGKIGILFPGQGSQYPGMVKELMCTSPAALNSLSQADKKIGNIDGAGNHLVDYIYPRPTYNPEKDALADDKLKSTDVAQPSLGAVSIGMYKTLRDFGLEPSGFAGHSYGELVSLCAAGLFDSEALALISRKRGQLMAQGSGDRGGMVAVIGERTAVEAIMKEANLDLVVANHNSNKQVVLSGKTSEIERSKDVFKAKKLRATVLNVAGAFHSKFVADAAKPFYEYLQGFEFGKLKYPVYANTTAEKYPTDKEEARKLLGNQLANQVRFVEIIQRMYADGIRTFIEAGPNAVLSGLIKSILDTEDYNVITLDSSKGKSSSVVDFAKVIAKLSALGYKLDIEKWQNGKEWLNNNPIDNKPKLLIPICGANYKSKALIEHRKEIEKPAPTVRIPDSKPITKTETNKIDNEAPNIPTVASASVASQAVAALPTPPTPQINPMAMNTTIEALAALQIMQQETAELHKRFLEGQELAQKALLAALGQNPSASDIPSPIKGETRFNTNLPPTVSGTAHSYSSSLPPTVSGTAHSYSSGLTPTVSGTAHSPSSSSTSIPEGGAPSKASDGGVPSATLNKIKNTLVEVVSEKTGYPAEMLNLDMDMEADLGIDSIKRVEIMSAMQERCLEAPVVQPDQLSKLRTLNAILEVLNPPVAGATSALEGETRFITELPPISGGVAPAKASDGGVPSATLNKIKTTLVEVVSEKTGYPAEMLNLDMDMEADLGIDSIKRVEIMSAMQERCPEAPVVQPDQLSKLRTLNAILEVLNPPVAGATSALEGKTSFSTALPPTNDGKARSSSPSFPPLSGEVAIAKGSDEGVLTTIQDFELKRTIIKAVEIGKPEGLKTLKAGDSVVISNDDKELSEALVAKLEEEKINAETLSLADMTSGKFPKEIKALIILAPKPEKATLNLWEESSEEWLKDVFMAIKAVGATIKANKGLIATISRMDGNFGLASMTKNVDPIQGGLAGISKTTRHEWPEVISKAIDLDYRLKDVDTAAKLLAEELTVSGPMETGLSKTSRIMIEEIEEPCTENPNTPPAFQKGDTIIVTGGARGVTAETAIAFAEKYGTNMVLIGRSPLPEAEPVWLASITDEASIKRAIMENSKSKITPKELGVAYKTAMANREVLTNMARLKNLGVKVKYASASVLNEAKVCEIISEARSEMGNIAGIIHGAGVKRDKNIEDKTREQLNDVIDTKVRGLKNVLKATVQDDLKVIVLFSSFSGRQGRTGQVDYAMANETLNKIAQKLKVLRSDCHVMSFNWGPWDGGMVDPSLRKVFINEGIGLIPLKKGANCPIVELSNNNDIEIGIIGLIDGKEALSSSKKA